MARNDLQKILLDAFREAAGPQELTERLSDPLKELLLQLRFISHTQIDALGQNTQAVLQNTAAQVTGASGRSTAGSVGRVISTVFGSGLGLTPLFSGLARLLGGGKSDTTQPLLQHFRPPALRLDGGISQSAGQAIYPVDYGQDGRPRLVPPAASGNNPQITIQVQAIDSRSFLDHSDKIARAVREAMLNSHSLNDIVNEV